MRVILLQDVAKVGSRYEVKDVARGHAQNFLIPRGLAEAATPAALATLENRKAQATEKLALSDAALVSALNELNGKTLSLSEKTNTQGHLFAAVHEKEIANAVQKEFGVTLNPSVIKFPEPIKQVGKYDITLMSGDVSVTLSLHITPAEE